MNRILTTHCGSLPRPHDLLDLMKSKVNGQPYDAGAYERRVRKAVADAVRKQADTGIDILSDGEQSKPGFFTYLKERLAGFEARPGAHVAFFEAERAAFPEYYKEYFARAMLGGSVAPVVPMVCTGPVSYRGADALARDIDDPFLSDLFSDPALDDARRQKKAAAFVDAINHALRGIPQDKVRFHTCYGINEGPRIHDAALKDVAAHMLRINAGFYSFEAANARHEHEYHLWETLKLPAGKVLIPGVITHASNIVEHPELIAERLVRFAKLVGRENVIAGADCGFSSQATYHTEVHPTVVWAKFEAMREGARLATKQLWS